MCVCVYLIACAWEGQRELYFSGSCGVSFGFWGLSCSHTFAVFSASSGLQRPKGMLSRSNTSSSLKCALF